VRATTAFNPMVAPLGVTVTNVAFEGDVAVLSIRSKRRRARCSCGWSTGSIYDRSQRRWRHLDAFGTQVFLHGEIRRLACKQCHRVVTEAVQWARPRGRHTFQFDNVVAWWCQHTDRTSVATFMRCDWETVTSIVARVLVDHLDDGRFDGLTRIGVDEISWAGRHQYLTVVVDQVGGHVIWVHEGKNADVLKKFYKILGEKRCAELTAVSMDMGRAYSAATTNKTRATICWDPFHLVKLLNKAIGDTIRWSKLTRQGLPMSSREANDLRWAMLKVPSDLTDAQAEILNRHRKQRHVCWRAQQLKEDFRGLYQLADPADAEAYLDRWLARACRSRIPPMVKVSRSIRNKREGVLAAVELGLSNSRLEGTNSKIRLLNHRGYGHHSAEALISMIYLCCSGITVDLGW
jgi:transposase